MKKEEKTVQEWKAKDVVDTGWGVQMPFNAKPLDIGWVQGIRVEEKLDATRAVVIITETSSLGSGREYSEGRFVITGIDTTKWDQDKKDFTAGTFIATDEKAKERLNLVVLTPFDADAWKGKYKAPKPKKKAAK